MKIALILSILAGLIHVFAFFVYNRKIFRGKTIPNTATWTLWAFVTCLNSASYLVMSTDLIKSLLPIMSSIACVVTFAVCFCKGKLSKLNFWDNVVLVIGILACVIWVYFNSATYANLIFQICIAISFIPTYRSVWEKADTENAMPWFIWGSGHVLLFIVIIIRWKGQYQDLVYPINCFFLHAVVVCLVYRNAITEKIKGLF